MLGLPFRFVPPADWDTMDIVLTEHLIYFVAEGRCRARVGSRHFELRAGELCWVCPGAKFRFWAEQGTPVVQRFRLGISHGREILRLKWPYRVFQDALEAVEWGRTLVAESDQKGRFAAQRFRSLAALFSASVFESRRQRVREPGLPLEIRRRISSHVLDHPGERLTPVTLARLAGLSPDYFSRLFRKSFGMSPRDWLLKQRMQHAADLLLDAEWRISEVATRLGYPDLYLFSRQFKTEFGRSPREWRRYRSVQSS